MSPVFIAFICPLAGYLIGSVSSAILVSRMLALPDPRSGGSGNPGATNVLRLGGKKAALITLACDLAKGALAVLIARALGADSATVALTGFAAFAGHAYPIFFAFKGGKGVATAGGVFIALNPTVGAALLGVWLTVALVFRYSSLAALTAAIAAPILTYILLPEATYFFMSLSVACLLIWRHRRNVGRLVRGVEGKIKLG